MKLMLDENTEIELLVEARKVKNLTMRVLLDGTVKVTAPVSMPQERIFEFVQSKKNWIVKQQQLQKNRREHAALKNAKGPRIQLLGKTYHAVFKPGAKEGFELNQDDMILTAKDETRIQLVFEKQAKLMLEELLNQKRGKLDLIMDDYRLNHPEIAIKKMKGKWGSCTPAQAKIVMNLMLIHLPVKCIEYVLIHEYMHMICPNHSKRFYELIENVMPDYRRYMKMLKEE